MSEENKNCPKCTSPYGYKDGHDISCKIEDYGSVYLKCSVVKKVK